ncbi:MAG: transposase [Desulfobulbaceae bacterium]|nr:transposase [Desulfobulbaceae bacterium]
MVRFDFVGLFRTVGQGVLTAPASPWQNAYVERVIGTIRRECLDHTIIPGMRHLRRTVERYVKYYNGVRTHLSLSCHAGIVAVCIMNISDELLRIIKREAHPNERCQTQLMKPGISNSDLSAYSAKAKKNSV